MFTQDDVVLTPSQKVIKSKAEEYGLTYRDLVYNRSRDALTTVARHEAIKAVKRAFPHLTNSKIGQMFGGMDPSSILYIIRKDTQTQGWAAKLPSTIKKPYRPIPYAGSATAN